MALPEPKPGLIIRYDYLWGREAAAGRDQGKDRPALVLATIDMPLRPRHVVLAPITHTPPSGSTVGIEIPAKVKRALGLDDSQSWVVVSEHNVDEWPNAGIMPLPGKPGRFSYGFIPPGLFAQIKSKFLELARAAKIEFVRRPEIRGPGDDDDPGRPPKSGSLSAARREKTLTEIAGRKTKTATRPKGRGGRR